MTTTEGRPWLRHHPNCPLYFIEAWQRPERPACFCPGDLAPVFDSPAVPEATEDPRNALAAMVAQIYDYPFGCPGEHGNSQQITYLIDALERAGWKAPSAVPVTERPDRQELIKVLRVPIAWKDNHTKTLDYLMDEADAEIAADAVLDWLGRRSDLAASLVHILSSGYGCQQCAWNDVRALVGMEAIDHDHL